MGLFDLANSNRKPMTKPGDKFESVVTSNGDRIDKYRPGDSDEKYTQIVRKNRTTEIYTHKNK